MDNRQLNIISEGQKSLASAIAISWAGAAGGKATHYKIVKLKKETRYYGEPKTTHHFNELKESDDGIQTLILLWHEEQEAKALPYPLELDGAINFISLWLKTAELTRRPDIDGDSEACGWRIFTESWGHVAGHTYAIVGVQPVWAMYGK